MDFKPGEEVLARWTDCRYYPAKIEAINKEGTFTVQFYDGVIRCLKRIHIKSMPEDAKGQDWIALVKAAAVAAAKNKAGVKPRTSANSNKDKEERKWFKVPSKKEETSTSAIVQKVQKKEEQPTSSETFGFPLVDVPKIAFVQAENALAHKRKNNLGNSFQAKRARLNKITGLLASKAVWADGAEKKEDCKEAAPVLEQEISPKPQSQKKNEADISSSANIQKSALLPSNLSSGKSRSKKCKQESGDSAGCLKPLKTPFSPELIQVEDLTLVSQLPSSGINKTIPNVAHISLEKHGLSLPLDLSSNLDVSALFPGKPTLYSKHPRQEKEENHIIRCHLSKTGMDGRIAPVVPGTLKIERKSKLEERSSSLLGMNIKLRTFMVIFFIFLKKLSVSLINDLLLIIGGMV
uniref:Tudor domain-containing protein n=1 Tax=Micrurus lemniscatus lemniscatus TaxID=129467 RepID=A0A2D4HEJ5_MICLE